MRLPFIYHLAPPPDLTPGLSAPPLHKWRGGNRQVYMDWRLGTGVALWEWVAIEPFCMPCDSNNIRRSSNGFRSYR